MELLIDPNRIIYVTKTGKKIHLRRDCLTIKQSKVQQFKYNQINKEKYYSICQKCEMKETLFKTQKLCFPKQLKNNLLSISTIHPINNLSSSEYEAIPDDFSLNNNNNINNQQNNLKKSPIYNNSNNNSSFINYNNNNNNFNNNNNDLESISKKEPSFVNKSKTDNKDCMNINDNSIENIYVDDEEESTVINTNKRNEFKQIKLDLDNNKSIIDFNKRNKPQYNFIENFIFFFDVKLIVKNNISNIKIGFSIIYIDDEDVDSFDTLKMIHNFSIKNNTKINYLINLKEGFYIYEIQEDSQKPKKKQKYFQKIYLLNIFQIKPYLKTDKENECEYIYNDKE